MNEQVNANEVIKYLQQELADKNLEVAILKAKLFDTKKDETKPEEKPAQANEQQEGEN